MKISETPSWINDYNRNKIANNKLSETAKKPDLVLLPKVKGIVEDNPLYPNLKATEQAIPVRIVNASSMTVARFSQLLDKIGIHGGQINSRLADAVNQGDGEKLVYPHYLSATTSAYANMRLLQSETPVSFHQNLSKLASNEIFIRGNNAFAPATNDHEGFNNPSVSNNIDFLIQRESRLQGISAESLVNAGYIKQDDTVLDVGCGSGYFAKKLNERNISTVAIEPFMPPAQTPREAIFPEIQRQSLHEHLNDTNKKYSVVYVGNIYPVNDQKETLSNQSLKNFVSDVHRATQANGSAIIGVASIDSKYLVGNKPNNLRELLEEKFGDVSYVSAKNVDATVFESDGAIGGQIGFFIAKNP